MNPLDGAAGVRGLRVADHALLDDQAAMEAADPGRMLRATASAGAQVRESASLAAEADFRPGKHRYITHQQARAIDSAIDQYNATIADAVRHARSEGRRWYLLDLCGILDGLAQRRYVDDSDAAEANGWEPYPLPAEFEGLLVRRFRVDQRRSAPVDALPVRVCFRCLPR